MANINLEALRKSFVDIRKYIAETLDEISELRLIKSQLGSHECSEEGFAISDRIYGKFFDLYRNLSKDYVEREKLYQGCENTGDRIELGIHLNSLHPLLNNLSKNLEDIALVHLRGFDEFLKSSGKEYARGYLEGKV